MSGHSTIAIVTGPKAGGKTFTAREIVSIHPCFFALDVHGGSEFGLDGAVRVRNTAQLKKALLANATRPSWLIVYAPDFDVKDASEVVADVAYGVGRCLAVFDEAHAYMTASRLGERMGRLVLQARHETVNVVVCSPRLADISTDVRTQADIWVVCGSLWTKPDLDALEEHTSTEFRRAAQEPLEEGQHRRLGFDTRTRKPFDVTREELRRLFRL
jgi:hypothetical protein